MDVEGGGEVKKKDSSEEWGKKPQYPPSKAH
jgi:hypothetical protein